jgi:hypothetical protein
MPEDAAKSAPHLRRIAPRSDRFIDMRGELLIDLAIEAPGAKHIRHT